MYSQKININGSKDCFVVGANRVEKKVLDKAHLHIYTYTYIICGGALFMAGKMCPKCGRQTLWNKGGRLECSNPECGYKVFIPANQGMGGKGKKCPVCGKFPWFQGKCTSCGSHE